MERTAEKFIRCSVVSSWKSWSSTSRFITRVSRRLKDGGNFFRERISPRCFHRGSLNIYSDGAATRGWYFIPVSRERRWALTMVAFLPPSRREAWAFLGVSFRAAVTKVTITSRREKRGEAAYEFLSVSGPQATAGWNERGEYRDGPLSRKNHLLRPSSFDDQSYWRGDVTRVGCASQWGFRMMQQKSSFRFPSPSKRYPDRSQRARERERESVCVWSLFSSRCKHLKQHC